MKTPWYLLRIGATGAVDKLIGILNLRIPAISTIATGSPTHPAAERRWSSSALRASLNELPWRESIVDVVENPGGRRRHVDGSATREELKTTPTATPHRQLLRRVERDGILTMLPASRPLHEHGALSFWDYAAAARMSN